jgi:hypothetical protein
LGGHLGEAWAEFQQGMLKHVPIPLCFQQSCLRPQAQCYSLLAV